MSATTEDVRGVLAYLAKQFGKGREWVESQLRPWYEALGDVAPHTLVAAAESWANTQDRPPNLAQFRRTLPRTTANAAGCGTCADGWRIVSRHLSPEVGPVVLIEKVARCGCELGMARSHDVPLASDVLATWRNSPATLWSGIDASPKERVVREGVAVVRVPERSWQESEEVPF